MIKLDFIKDNYPFMLIVISYGVLCGLIAERYLTNLITKVLATILCGVIFSIIYLYLAFSPFSFKHLFVPNNFLNMRNSFVIKQSPNSINNKILNCDYIKQEKDLCSTTCAEIVLKYYGDNKYNQKQIKCLAENKQYDPNTFNSYYGTSFVKIVKGLSEIGYNWKLEKSPKNKINTIKEEIKNNRPVIVSTPFNVKYNLKMPFIDIITHSMVVYGYDMNNNFYIIDPSLREGEIIKINEKSFEEIIFKYILLTSPKYETKNNITCTSNKSV